MPPPNPSHSPRADQSPDARFIVLACVLFAASFVLRLMLISKGPYSVDTLNLALKAEQLVTTLQLTYSYGSGYPLTIVCGGVFVLLGKITGVNDPVLAVNFMSVVMGAACIPLMMGVTRRLVDATTAIFAAVFLSVAPIFLAVSTYGLSHAPALFFLLAGVWFLLRYRDGGRRTDFIFSAIAVGFLGGARLQNLVLMALPLAYLLWTVLPRRRVKGLITFAAIAAAAMIVWYLPYVLGEGREAYLSQFVKYKDDSVIPNASPGLLFKPFLNIVYHIIHTYTPVGIMMVVLGGWLLSKEEPKNAGVFLLLWLLLPVILYSRLYTLVPRFLTIMHPPLCLYMGFFCAHYFREGRGPRAAATVLAAVMSVGMLSIVYPVLKARHERAYIPEYVRWVVRQVPANARIITVDDSLFYHYYSNLQLLSRFHNQYRVDFDALDSFPKQLDSLLRQQIPVYITEHGLYNYDPNGYFAELMTTGYRLEEVGSQTYEFWQESCWQPGRYPRKLFQVKPLAEPEAGPRG